MSLMKQVDERAVARRSELDAVSNVDVDVVVAVAVAVAE